MGNLVICPIHKRQFLPPGECHECIVNKKTLAHIEEVQARFMGYTLPEQVEKDFTWLITILKERINGGK